MIPRVSDMAQIKHRQQYAAKISDSRNTQATTFAELMYGSSLKANSAHQQSTLKGMNCEENSNIATEEVSLILSTKIRWK